MADHPIEPIRLVIDNANEVPPPLDPETPNSGGGSGAPDRDPDGLLPDGCPVTPLGVLGDTCFYLDDLNQLRELAADKHGRLGLQSLFGKRNYLLQSFWPRYSKEGEVVGWKPEIASATLMAAAAWRGVWDPLKRVRGRGSWLAADGSLVIHCGDALLADRAWRQPGLAGSFVYPAYEALPRPWEQKVPPGDAGAGAELLQILNTWNWRNKDLDALLMLGWIASAMVGGALSWRPVAWVTGGSSTGKSTLQGLLEGLFDGALIQAAEASAAGIWQELGYATLPVAVDELESEEDSRKAQAIVKLARLAASGGLILRGGADHVGSKFMARSCFLFSSILLPALLGQDRNRIAILELGELHGTKPPNLGRAKLGDLGRKLLRRLVDGWPRWNDTLEVYRAALSAKGHSARRCDVFATLLAAADLVLSDGEPSHDFVEGLADRLEHIGAADYEENQRDEERWLAHLLTTSLPLDGGVGRRPIGEWVRRACEEMRDDTVLEAERVLGTYGLKVIRDRDKGNAPAQFAVANYHQGLARIFEGTHWAARSGTMGVWVQAVRRLPEAERSKSAVYFAGVYAKATVMPVDLVFQPAEDDHRQRQGSMPVEPLD